MNIKNIKLDSNKGIKYLILSLSDINDSISLLRKELLSNINNKKNEGNDDPNELSENILFLIKKLSEFRELKSVIDESDKYSSEEELKYNDELNKLTENIGLLTNKLSSFDKTENIVGESDKELKKERSHKRKISVAMTFNKKLFFIIVTMILFSIAFMSSIYIAIDQNKQIEELHIFNEIDDSYYKRRLFLFSEVYQDTAFPFGYLIGVFYSDSDIKEFGNMMETNIDYITIKISESNSVYEAIRIKRSNITFSLYIFIILLLLVSVDLSYSVIKLCIDTNSFKLNLTAYILSILAFSVFMETNNLTLIMPGSEMVSLSGSPIESFEKGSYVLTNT